MKRALTVDRIFRYGRHAPARLIAYVFVALVISASSAGLMAAYDGTSVATVMSEAVDLTVPVAGETDPAGLVSAVVVPSGSKFVIGGLVRMAGLAVIVMADAGLASDLHATPWSFDLPDIFSSWTE